MAHLQLVSLHPFEDGNGRISRIVQSLVLALRGETVAELGSIEPYSRPKHGRVLPNASKSVQGGTHGRPNATPPSWLKILPPSAE